MTPPPPSPQPEVPPRLPPGALSTVAMTSLLVLAVAALVVVWSAVALEQGQRYAAARGLLVGHFLGQAVTLSWLLGVFLTFQRSTQDLFSATIALWPARLFVIVVGLTLAAGSVKLDPTAMFLTLLGTYALGIAVEGWTLFRLQALAEQPEQPDP